MWKSSSAGDKVGGFSFNVAALTTRVVGVGGITGSKFSGFISEKQDVYPNYGPWYYLTYYFYPDAIDRVLSVPGANYPGGTTTAKGLAVTNVVQLW